jgi:adenine-specific DNA-methyltransferase
MSKSTGVELRWSNKKKVLYADSDDSYLWLATDDPRCLEIRGLESQGRIGVPNEGGNEGLVIVGDALDALKAVAHNDPPLLSPASIRLVYIDPPFNTGQVFAQYLDDLEHSQWLSLLRDRLEAVKPFLAPEASIWVHLDDAEVHRARCVLDEVFGSQSFVSTVVWQKRNTRESRSAFSSNHDYIHVYAPAGPRSWKQTRNLLPRDSSSFKNPDQDERGPWLDAPFTAPGYRANQQYKIINPAGRALAPPKGRSWYATEPVFDRLTEENRIWFPNGGDGLPRLKRFADEVQGLVPFSLWGSEVGTNDDAKRQLMTLFPDAPAFSTPKPETLLERIIHIGTDPGDLVVDFFGGSGTTAAVAQKTGRKWFIVERSPEVVDNYIVPRLRKVVESANTGGIKFSGSHCEGGSFEVLRVTESGVEKRGGSEAACIVQSPAPKTNPRTALNGATPQVASVRGA